MGRLPMEEMKPSIESVEKARNLLSWQDADLIAQAISEARQEGREEMREEAASCAYDFCPDTLGLNHKVSQAILNLK